METAILAILLAAMSGTDTDPRKTPVVLAVQRVAPAVVNISSEQRSNPYATDDPFFSQFFRDFYGTAPSRNRSSLGSGVIVDDRGYILTNEHVILKGSRITVTLADKREFTAKVVGADPDSDLAVLKVDGGGSLPVVPMGRSSDLMIGESVIAIGNPFGLSHTVTTGIVSAINRSLQADDGALYGLIQTDASINPGNSGGPLLNISGELIGINTAIYQNAQGIGFAIPIDRAKRVVRELIAYGNVRKAWIGLQVEDERDESGVARRLRVAEITARSPAASAEFQIGDVIVSVNGYAVRNTEDYGTAVERVGVGDEVVVDVDRGGLTIRRTMKAADFTLDAASSLCWDHFGLEVKEVDRVAAGRYGLRSIDGMIITAVDPRSRAARIGIKRGIVIREIGGIGIVTAQDFISAMSRVRKNQSVLFMIEAGGEYYRVKLFSGA